MGADNLAILKKWYKGEEIIKNYKILVYPREGYNIKELCKEYGAIFIDAPLHNISSTQIREMISKGEDVSKLVY
jgi:Nicotinic acid mononucleotide adenylyltransferase